MINKYDLKHIKDINLAKRLSSMRKVYDFEGFFMDDEILRAS